MPKDGEKILEEYKLAKLKKLRAQLKSGIVPLKELPRYDYEEDRISDTTEN